MRLISLVLLFNLPFAFANEHVAEPGLETKSAKQSSRDVKVPRGLVALIERDYRAFLVHEQVSAEKEKSFKRKLLNVSVDLTEKRHAALHENVRVNTPLGGGVIDLADLVTPVRGAFQMKIRAGLEKIEEPLAVKVYFVSRAKARVLAGEQYGAGCDRFMEITDYFSTKMAHEGFELYTADQRYVSVLSGTFVLVAFDKEALMVGSVSFMDSRFPEFACE